MAAWYTKNVDDFYQHDDDKLKAIMRQNAENIFPAMQKTMGPYRSKVGECTEC
jgi:hypothetical protein